MSNVNYHALIALQTKFGDQVVAGSMCPSLRIDTAVHHKNALGSKAVCYHHRFNFMRNCNVEIGHKAVFDTGKT